MDQKLYQTINLYLPREISAIVCRRLKQADEMEELLKDMKELIIKLKRINDKLYIQRQNQNYTTKEFLEGILKAGVDNDD